MESIGRVTIIIVLMIVGFLLGLLGVTVVLSLANLYQLAFITNMSFIQIYGLWLIISIIRFKYEPKDEDQTFSEAAIESTKDIFVKVFILLFSWGMGFIAYYILK